MNGVFLDTKHLVAMLNPGDNLHGRAVEIEKLIEEEPLITSELVLGELLNFFSDRSDSVEERAYFREQSVGVVRALQADEQVEIVDQSPELFEAALSRYADRRDKGYSLVDCTSMIIMERRGLIQVATADHHFRQAGFATLLDPPR